MPKRQSKKSPLRELLRASDRKAVLGSPLTKRKKNNPLLRRRRKSLNQSRTKARHYRLTGEFAQNFRPDGTKRKGNKMKSFLDLLGGN